MYSQLHMDYYRLSYPFLSVYASKLNYICVCVWLLRSREQMSLAMVLAF